MKTLTKNLQKKLTPEEIYNILTAGNERFVNNVKALRDLKQQVKITRSGQYPYAAVLGCIDSRAPAELVFDLGIGDIFNVRVAGNIVNEDVLGSLEYSCKVAGARIILVLGHTKCGAVSAACNHVEMGNITPLLKKIKPAVDFIMNERGQLDERGIDDVAVQNVYLSMERIRNESPVLSEMEKKGEIEIMGGIYNVSTGKVKLFR